jgi:PII-like signaling protein
VKPLANSLTRTPAQQAWVYIEESDRWQGRPLWEAMLEKLKQAGCPGLTVLRALAGYGAHGLTHTAHLVELSSNLPLVLSFIDSPQRISEFLDILWAEFGSRGLVVVSDVTLIHRNED